MSSKPTRCGETNQKYIFINPTKKKKKKVESTPPRVHIQSDKDLKYNFFITCRGNSKPSNILLFLSLHIIHKTQESKIPN